MSINWECPQERDCICACGLVYRIVHEGERTRLEYVDECEHCAKTKRMQSESYE